MVRSRTTCQRVVDRATVVLASADGISRKHNCQSDYLNSLHEDLRLHLFISGRGILDFAANCEFRPGAGLFVEATNLTDSMQRRYRGVVPASMSSSSSAAP